MAKKFPWTASVLALAVSSAFAQSAPQTTQSTNQYQLAYLDPVVVTASRFEQALADVPAFAQVITKEEIVESGATSVSEAVNKIGNINVRSLAGGPLGLLADIDMRGFGAAARDNALILVDGMRVSPIDSGSITWEAIPIGNVERIEIIHGGGSVQFGDKAVGGVINIITRGDLNQPSSAAITLGSYGTVLTNASLLTGWGSTRAKLDVVADSTDGWRENSQAHQGSLKGLLSHSLGGQDKVFVEGLVSYQQYHFPGGVVGEVNTGERKAAKFNNVGDTTTTRSSRGLVGVSKSLGSDLIFMAEVAYSDSKADQRMPYYANDGKPETAGTVVYDKWSYDITPRLKKIWSSNNDSVFGLDYQKATAGYLPDTGSIRNATVQNKSAYFVHRYLVTQSLDLSGGLRRQTQSANAYERYVDYANAGAVSITTANKQQSANAADLALTYRYGSELTNKIFLRLNRGFRFANTDEYWGCDYVAPDYYCTRTFNSILRPQRADTLEIGGSWPHGRSGVFSGTIYQIRTKDEIRYNDFLGTNINSPPIFRQGLSLRYRNEFFKNFATQSSVTLQRTEYRSGSFVGYDEANPGGSPEISLAGRKVPLSPSVLASVGISYRQSESFGGRALIRYVGSQSYAAGEFSNFGFDSSKSMPSYTVVDLGVRLKVGNWELDGQARNVFDKKYASTGGYGLVEGVGMSYYYYPGDPRTLWLSARYRFN